MPDGASGSGGGGPAGWRLETLQHAFLECPAVRPALAWLAREWARGGGAAPPLTAEVWLQGSPAAAWQPARDGQRMWRLLRITLLALALVCLQRATCPVAKHVRGRCVCSAARPGRAGHKCGTAAGEQRGEEGGFHRRPPDGPLLVAGSLNTSERRAAVGGVMSPKSGPMRGEPPIP